MKRIVELVDMSFKNSQKYFRQTIDIQHIKAKFVETLSAEQKHIFDQSLSSIYKTSQSRYRRKYHSHLQYLQRGF